MAAALARLGVGLAVWALLTAALAVPLVALGWWLAWAAALVLAGSAVVAVLVARRIPVVPISSPAAALLLAVAIGAGVWAGLTHAEHVVLRRDAGTYALFGHHLATAHGNVVDVAVDDLGGPAALAEPGVGVGSPGFYEQGSGASAHVVPQFLVATPVWLSVGWWLGGWTGLLLVPAITLAAALLAFAGLAARLVGGWWAVVATTALAVCQPVLHAGRSTYSEPLALLIGCAGGAVLVAATRAGRRDHVPAAGAARLGLLAGLLFGGVALVRVDALRETALLIPAAALLAIGPRGSPARRVAGPLVVGLLVATAVAAGAAAALSRPYVASVSGSLVPLGGAAVALAAGSAVLVLQARRGGRMPAALRAALPRLAPAVVLVVALLLATRPWWQTVRQSAADSGARVVAGLQQRQGLPIDGGRTYAEHSLQWVTWWLGVPVVVLAVLGAVAVAHRLGQAWADDEPLPGWTAPALMALGSVTLTLLRPGITPDHPWADRRLVPVVLPTMVLLAVVAARIGLGRLSARRPSRYLVILAGSAAVALVVAPALLATLPLAGQRTERGEVAAVRAACAAFGPGETAILVDSRAANEWTQVLRGVCDVPTVVVRSSTAEPADAAVVIAVAQAIVAQGRRPIVVSAGSPQPVERLGAAPRHVVHLVTTEDQRLLTRRPSRSARLDVDLWIAPAT